MRSHFNAALSRDFSEDSDLLRKLYQVGRAPACDCGEAIEMSEEETGETFLCVAKLHDIPFVNV